MPPSVPNAGPLPGLHGYTLLSLLLILQAVAWAVAAGPGTFTGFLDIVGAKGKDGFGDETKAETLGRALYMFDIGGAKSGFKAGAGVEYWNNKFGCNNAKSFVKNSCTATTPVLLVEYHM